VNLLRRVGGFIFNLLIATIGAAILEAEIFQFVPRSTSFASVIATETLLSVLVAAGLGTSFPVIARGEWLKSTAKWIWTIPVAILVCVTALNLNEGPVEAWSKVSGRDCPLSPAACAYFFSLTVPALRSATYSLAAWLVALVNPAKRDGTARTPHTARG
jgi:hypothetical protein